MPRQLPEILPFPWQQGRLPLVMGILNLSPDSFSDGGRLDDDRALVAQAGLLVKGGAAILDIGGESTRPGAVAVPEEEEKRRVLAGLRVLRAHFDLPISVDTSKAAVARLALAAGADMINDVSALADPDMAAVVAAAGVPVVLMHMRGTPRSMQKDPVYGDVVADIRGFLEKRIETATRAGIRRADILVDPGIGFGKTLEHNLAILRRLEEFSRLGCPLVLGHSRKSFLGALLGLEVGERDAATAQISALAWARGAAVLRVHDAAGSSRALELARALHLGQDRESSTRHTQKK